MQNIEFKSELRDLEAARAQCKVVGASFIGVLDQVDTFYKLPDGRLKRREAKGEPIEWIFYHRQNRIQPRLSNYTILSEELARRRWGTHSLKEWVVVRKKRELWMVSNVRIHLDVVEDLGTFIEFEAMVSQQFDVQECHISIAYLREEFGPILGEPIAMSYCDLVEQESPSTPPKR
jgi:adenylate cyclase class 2